MIIRLLLAALCLSLTACGTPTYSDGKSGKGIYSSAPEAYLNEGFRKVQQAALAGPEEERPWPGEKPITVKRAFMPPQTVFKNLPGGITTEVWVLIDESGSVIDIATAKGLGKQAHDDMLSTMKLWEFEPYIYQGKVTKTSFVIPFMKQCKSKPC